MPRVALRTMVGLPLLSPRMLMIPVPYIPTMDLRARHDYMPDIVDYYPPRPISPNNHDTPHGNNDLLPVPFPSPRDFHSKRIKGDGSAFRPIKSGSHSDPAFLIMCSIRQRWSGSSSLPPLQSSRIIKEQASVQSDKEGVRSPYRQPAIESSCFKDAISLVVWQGPPETFITLFLRRRRSFLLLVGGGCRCLFCSMSPLFRLMVFEGIEEVRPKEALIPNNSL